MNKKDIVKNTSECYIKNISNGTIKIGRNANNKPLITLPLNGCTVVSSEMMEDTDIKRAFNLGYLSLITEEETMKYENERRNKAMQFVPNSFENPMASMSVKEAVEYIKTITSARELENLITLEERDSVVDEIEKRIDELEDGITANRQFKFGDKTDFYEVD